jgi:protein SCO1
MRFVTNHLACLVLALIATTAGGIDRAYADDDSGSPGVNQLPSQYRNVGVTEHLNASLPLDLQFYDEHAQYMRLKDLLHPNRPILLQLGYLECPMLCDVISKSLFDTAKKTDLQMAKDFDFVFVSINPSDSPDMAAMKRESYVQECGDPAAISGIRVLTGRPTEIQLLADTVGYRYAPAPNGQFAHPAVAMVITPDGRISRYLYGVSFSPQTLRLSLVEASQGKIGSTVDQFLLICLHFDASSGKYTMTAVFIMRAAGLVTILALSSAIFWLTKRGNHLRNFEPPNQ